MKQYHHPSCLFETFVRARPTTRIITEPDDVHGFDDLVDEDQKIINNLIDGKFQVFYYSLLDCFLCDSDFSTNIDYLSASTTYVSRIVVKLILRCSIKYV